MSGILTLGDRIYLDPTVFIDALDGLPGHATLMHDLFEVFRKRPKRTVVSGLVLAEAMGKESPKVGRSPQSRFYLDLIVWSHFIDLIPITRDILWDTGEFRRSMARAGRVLKLPDAIHLSTAVKARCAFVLSADHRLHLPLSLQRLDPRSVTPAKIEHLLNG